MSNAGFASTDLSRIAPLTESPPGEPLWLPVRHRLGISAFGANAWVAREPGDLVIEEHDEISGGAEQHEELYLVTSGRASFRVGGETIDAPTGTLVFVRDPALVRSAVGESAGTTVLAVGARVGEPFSVSRWERKYL